MFLYLGLLTGLFWTIVYILIVRQGFRDRTFGMPIVALAANLSWEFVFAFVFPHRAPQLFINYAWLFMDLIILYQVLRYWRREFPTWTSAQFAMTLLAAFVFCFAAIVAITLEFQDFNGMYAAFGQNLMMSVLFVMMLQSRNYLRGQSLAIGVFKMLGTLASSLGFLSVGQGNGYLLPFFYLSIFVFDIVYIGLMLQRRHAVQAAAKVGTAMAEAQPAVQNG